MRASAFFGLVAATTAMGALAMGELVVLPGLQAQSALIDANLAKALAAPLHFRLSEVVLGAALVIAAVGPRLLRSAPGTALCLLLLGGAAAHRFVVLPALYAAWSRADLVAGRPVERVLAAENLATQEQWVAASLVVCCLALLAMTVHGLRDRPPAAPERATPTPTAAPPDEPAPSTGVAAPV